MVEVEGGGCGFVLHVEVDGYLGVLEDDLCGDGCCFVEDA